MATVRKTITLTGQQNAWIAAQIEAGSYIEGEQSGEPEPFDFAAFKRRKAAQLG